MNNYRGLLSHNFPNQQFNTTIQNNQDNVINNYRELGGEFVRYFYTTLTNNIDDIGHLYQFNTCVTYNGVELSGFYQYRDHMTRTLNINRLEFDLYEADGQPLDQNTLLVNVIGRVRANYDSSMIKKFSETFVLSRTGQNYQITRQMFRVFN